MTNGIQRDAQTMDLWDEIVLTLPATFATHEKMGGSRKSPLSGVR